MKENNCWGGSIELTLIPEIIKRPVYVFEEAKNNSTSGFVRILTFGDEFKREPIRILSIDNKHFKVLTKPENSSSGTSINQKVLQRFFHVTNENKNKYTMNATKIELLKTQGINSSTIRGLINRSKYNGGNNYTALDKAIRELMKKD